VWAQILDTVTARLAGAGTAQVSPVELILQVVPAGLGVCAVALTADRQPRPTITVRTGKPRWSRDDLLAGVAAARKAPAPPQLEPPRPALSAWDGDNAFPHVEGGSQ
jgi:hypothetical protein